MPFCSRCGSRLEPDARFCIACGVALPEATRAGTATGTASGVAPQPPVAGGGFRWKVAGGGLAAVLAAAVGYLYATPYIALNSYKDAIERRSVSELAGAVDAPALVLSVKALMAEARARIEREDRELGIQPSRSGLGVMAQLLGANIDQVLDKLVTEALKPESLLKLQLALSSGKSLLDEVPPQHRAEAEALMRRVDEEVHISTGYVGLNRFRVSARHEAVGTVNLLFDRHELVQWRLAGVEGGDALPLLMRQAGMAAPVSDLATRAINKQEWALARRWVQTAFHLGVPESRHRLAMLTVAGTPGQPANPQEGYRLLQDGVGARDAKSALVLGALYEAGLGLDQSDLDRAIEAYAAAHELGEKNLEFKLFMLNYISEPATPARMVAAGRWIDRWAQSFESTQSLPDRVALQRLSARLQQGEGISAAQAGTPPWVKALQEAKADGAGVGPLRFGMQVLEIQSILGPPDYGWISRDGLSQGLSYFARMPHPSLLLTFQFDGVRRADGPRRVLESIGFNERLPSSAKTGMAAVEGVLGVSPPETGRLGSDSAEDWRYRTSLCRWGISDLTDEAQLLRPTVHARARMVDRDDIGANVQVCRGNGRVAAVTFNNRD